jgi:hypothetical protein
MNMGTTSALWTTIVVGLLFPPLLAAQEPKQSNQKLKGKTQKVDDLSLTAINVPAKEVVPAMLWGNAEGAIVFVLDQNGTLRRIAVPEFSETHQLDIGRNCDWLSISGQGLIVTVAGVQQVWLVDPDTLQVKKKHPPQRSSKPSADPSSA